MKPTTEKRARWVQCRLSLAGASIAIPLCAWGLHIDIGNNYAIGASYLVKLGEVMALAAVAFAGAPTIAAIIGRWGVVTVATTVFAGVLTVASAYLAYTSGIAKQIDGVVTMQQKARTAREKRERLTADMAAADRDARAAAEQMSSTALRELREDALKRAEEESSKGRGGCAKLCKAAEADAAEYLRRGGLAEARERAELRRDQARASLATIEEAADTAEAQQTVAAMDTAAYFDISPEAAARAWARGLALVSIALTVGLGIMSHLATVLVMRAFGIVPLAMQPAQPTGLVVTPPPTPAPPVLALATKKQGRKRLTVEQRIKQFSDEMLRPAATKKDQATGGQMHAAFEEWWHQRCPGVRKPDAKKVVEVLTANGVKKGNRGGTVRYEAMIVAKQSA